MARITAKIESAQLEAVNKMNDIRQEMIDDTEGVRACLANYEAALKTWAKKLNFGTIGFRLPPPAINSSWPWKTLSSGCGRKLHTRTA